MACSIIYNNLDQPVGAENKEGNSSQLFQQILNDPQIKNFTQALGIYTGVYEQEEEPLRYENQNKEVFNSYSAAIRATNSGDIIALFGAKELYRVSSDISIENFSGLINNLIKSELLTGETEIDADGTKLYKTTGNSEYKRFITADSALHTAKSSVGHLAKKNSAGDLYFDMNLIDARQVLDKDDLPIYLTQQELESKSYSQLKRTTSDPIGITAEIAYKENNRAFGDTTPLEEVEIIPENILQARLKALLADLGVTTTSIESYSQKYADKNGVEPNAQALADITNKVIAFKDGEINTEDLTEEVAHFIVEATDPAQLENLLRNVHRTSEWSEQQVYRDIYGQKYSGEELETVVRKEILGKVLANSLQANFAARTTETETSITARLQSFFTNFIERIRGFFKPAYQQQLENYNKAIYQNLMNESLYDKLSVDQLKGKKYTYYSIEQAGIPEEYRQLQRAAEHLSQQQYQLSKKSPAPANQNMIREAKDDIRKAIESNDEQLQQTLKQKALLNLATVSTAQIDYLSRVIDTNTKKGYHFAQEENSVYQNFITKLEPLISQLNNTLNPKVRSEKIIKDKFEAALRKSIELKGKVPANNNEAIRNIVERVIQKNNISGQEEVRFRNDLTAVLTTAQKDTGWFHAHLGQLMHSQNILLNLAGDVIAKTMTEARQGSLPNIKQLLNQVEAAGFNPRFLKNLIGKDGYIINSIDNNKLQEIELEEKKRAFEIALGEVPENFEEVIKNLSTEDSKLYRNALTKIIRERTESFYTQQYIDKLDNTFIEVDGDKIYRKDLPEIALEFEQQYRAQLSQIRVNNGGENTAEDKYQIQDLNKERAKASNPYNLDGSLKEGLTLKINEDGSYDLRLDINRSTSDEAILEAQKVYGLNLITELNRKAYEGNAERTGIPEAFIERLNSFETEAEKWEFVQLNSYIGFKQDYWNNFGQGESLIQRLNNTENEEAQEVALEIRGQQQVIANVLRAHRVFNQPSETNVTDMEDTSKSAIKDATIRLESLYMKANTFLSEEERVDEEPFSESRLNDAFRQDLEDEQITTDDGILNHIIKHVTPKNRSAIDKAIKIAEKLKSGEETAIDRSMQRVFNEDMSAEEVQRSLMNFAESKLLPYYKRSEPIGYSQERAALQQGITENREGAVEEFIKNSEFTEVSPSYSFYGENEAINPVWLDNKNNKRPQYTKEFLSAIRNSEYFERYGITNEDDSPTRNKEEFAARKAILDLQDKTIEYAGLTGNHNRYQLPQQPKSSVRRMEGFLKSFDFNNLRQNLNDLVNFREDEADLAQDEEGNFLSSNSRIETVPLYGFRKLPNQTDVTDELLHSYAWMHHQASLYKARKENIGDMLSLGEAIQSADYVGKSAQATNTFKMFKSFLNANFYSQNESFNYEISLLGKKVNLGKLAKIFNSWVRYVNLTGIVVPLTSLFQSKVQKNVENLVGETTNVISSKLARKEFYKYASGAAGEIMNLNSKSKINVLLESYGVYDLQEGRFQNTNYGKATRTALQFSSGLHSLGNFPVIPEVALSILYDNRYVDGSIINFNEYKRRNRGQNKKEIENKWQQLPLLYEDISTIGGVQTYNREAIAQKTGWAEEELDSRINGLHEGLSNRINAAIQDIDTQIRPEERSIAARDARASFILMHSNWLILSLLQRFKSSHYDISRQTYSEGSWITAANFVKDFVSNPKEVSKLWNEAKGDEVKLRNLRRTGVDLAVGNALAVLALLLANYVDDEDDVIWPLAFADYMTTRVANEQISGTLALPNQVANSISDPLIAADRFYALFDVLDIFSSEESQSPNYQGYSLRKKWLYQNLPALKDIKRLEDPKQAAETYRYFNKDMEDYGFLAKFFIDDEEE